MKPLIDLIRSEAIAGIDKEICDCFNYFDIGEAEFKLICLPPWGDVEWKGDFVFICGSSWEQRAFDPRELNRQLPLG